MNLKEIEYKIALSYLHGMGAIRVAKLLSNLGDISEVFHLKLKTLGSLTGLKETQLISMKRTEALEQSKLQLEWCHKLGIKPLFFLDDDYPRRLRQCADAPVILYQKGEIDLNQRRMVSIVGTRGNTEYGKELLIEFVKGVKQPDLCIVSGLALGTDGFAHNQCILEGIPTVGVLGHGLNEVFPRSHTKMAMQILQDGGALVSEFPVFTKPIRENFPMRNRIIAGLSDALVVVESQVRGGSMISAELANDYSRDVFAFPGSVRQMYSKGCNALIQQQKAHLVSNSNDFLKLMGWGQTEQVLQTQMKIDCTPEELILINLLRKYECLHLDVLVSKLAWPTSKAQVSLLGLQMKNAVVALPGNRYSVC